MPEEGIEGACINDDSDRLKSAEKARHRPSLLVVSSIVLQDQLIILRYFKAPYTLEYHFSRWLSMDGETTTLGTKRNRSPHWF